MRQRLAMAFLGLGLLCFPGAASAQSFGFYFGSLFGYSDAYYDDDYYRGYYGPGFRIGFYGPRVYGYVYRRAPVTTNVYYRRPVGRSGCGVYRFWNGSRCIDARYR